MLWWAGVPKGAMFPRSEISSCSGFWVFWVVSGTGGTRSSRSCSVFLKAMMTGLARWPAGSEVCQG